jgi:predicted transcriptional regulator
MSREAGEGLSRRERQIMDIVYRLGAATAAEVLRELPDPPQRAPVKTTVRTLLRILEEKGHLQHEVRGQTYVYRPSRSRQQAGQSALRRVLATFFDDSLEKAVAAHLSDEAVELSPEELTRLLQLIKDSRAKGR